MRLGADTEDEILFDAHARTVVKIIGRPVDFAQLAFVQAHDGPLPVKIVEIFGVDAGKFLAQQLIDEIADCGGGRCAGVAPAGKRRATGPGFVTMDGFRK